MTAPGAAGDVPVDVGPDEARDAAGRELLRPIYLRNEPSLLERAIDSVLRELGELLAAAGGAAPGGYPSLILLVALAVAALVAVRLTTGKFSRTAGRGLAPVFGDAPRTAAQHRHAADEHAVAGQWAEAVRERFRAIVRGLEERDLLDARPGRTADEVATEAGAALPSHAAELAAAARLFDEVAYGARPADADSEGRMRAVDEQVRRVRPEPRPAAP